MENKMENPLLSVFRKSTISKIEQITLAIEMLQEGMDHKVNPQQVGQWVRALQSFNGEQLAIAFNWDFLTCQGWPTLNDITSPIFEEEYAADLTWLLLGLKRHKKTWKDREPIYGPDVRVRNDAESHFDFVRGEMLEAAIPAPPIPPRLMHALQVMGAGTVADGLAELSRHPMTGAFSWDAAEAGKVKFQTERDFKAAWTIARRRELAGGTQ